MELGIYLAFLMGGLVVGGAVTWAWLRSNEVRLGAHLSAAQEADKARVAELVEARRDADSWRDKYQAEQLERAKFEVEARRVVGLEARVTALGEEIAGLSAVKAQLQTRIEEQGRTNLEKIAALTEVRGEIEKDLKNITADALRANQGTFLQLANEVFEKHKSGADADLQSRQKAVEALVTPLQQTLQSYKQQVDELEKARSHSYGALSAELKGVVEAQNAVRTETSKLVNALRAAPKTRGRWGEHTLRNVLELSGLSSFCDFSTEESFARDGSFARPDCVIRLPGGRSIVIDAKTSLSAYLDAVDAIDDAERDRHLGLHAAQIRSHVKQLAAKTYWDGLTVTPDFVVMFVPGDNFYAAALERDPSLFEDAAAQRVIIVTPATLIALAKAVAFGWRQEKVAENAQRVHALGRELYRRMIAMTEHIGRCGDALGNSVRHFNQFVGSLEHLVMPQARRFNELEVEGTATEIPALEHVELEPRLLRSDRDFAEARGVSPQASLVRPN
jgi:DNA recombination protein RmuC